jgi:hypothetical protein
MTEESVQMVRIKRNARALMLSMALTLIAVPTALHAEITGRFTILGEGNTSCGSWLEQRKDASAWKNEAAWVLGYLTAINEFVWKGGSNVAKGTDPSGMEVWMDAYCASHPLNNVKAGAQQLFHELVARQQR